jgi:hypothetical protein
MLPAIYTLCAREAATALFGSWDLREAGDWTVLPQAVLCFATLGHAESDSRFATGGCFQWRGDGLPDEARGDHRGTSPLHLFARGEASGDYLYLGEMERSYSFGQYGGDPWTTASFRMARALPAAVWQRLGGLDLDPSYGPRLDALLARLPGTRRVDERLQILEGVLRCWNRVPPPPTGEHWDWGLGLAPLPLRWWYARFGGAGVLTRNDHLVEPRELKAGPDGKVAFFAERQGAYAWATLSEGEDPPVWGMLAEEGEAWKPESDHLTTFLIAQALEAGILDAPYAGLSEAVPEHAFQVLTRVLPPLPLPPSYWPTYPSRLFARDGAVMSASPNPDGSHCVWIGARTEHPLEPLRRIPGLTWRFLDA